MNNSKFNWENFLLEYLCETASRIREIDRQGGGRKILGGVRGRPDDEELEIDQVGEKILAGKIKKHKLSIKVFSEHGVFGEQNNPEFFGALDPFDGSAFFKRGLHRNWYAALGIFDKKSNPVASGAVDILGNFIYLAIEKGSWRIDLESGDKTTLLPSQKKTLDEKSAISVVFYKMRRAKAFFEEYKSFISKLADTCLLIDGSNPLTVANVAEGGIECYLILNMPRIEIDTTLFIAQKAGCLMSLFGRGGKGKIKSEPYRFLPGKQGERVDVICSANWDIAKDAFRKMEN